MPTLYPLFGFRVFISKDYFSESTGQLHLILPLLVSFPGLAARGNKLLLIPWVLYQIWILI